MPNQIIQTAALAVLASLSLTTGPASAAAQCGPRDQVLTMLADRYSETRRGLGLAPNNAVMELFANDDSGSWTIILTLPDGQSCLVGSGLGFEAVTENLPARGEKV